MSNKRLGQDLDDAFTGILRVATKLGIQLWNHAMRGILATGSMPTFRSAPWLFAVIILVMLVVFTPVGIVLLLMGLSAASKSPKREDDFIVELEQPHDGSGSI